MGAEMNELALIKLPPHSIQKPIPLTSRDYVESNAYRDFYNRTQQVNVLRPSFNLAVARERKGFFKPFIKLIYKKSKDHLTLRTYFRKITWSLPSSLRNFILMSIAPSNQWGLVHEPFFDLDLGLGIETSDSPKVSIIMPVFNKWFITLRAIKALKRNYDLTPYELIIVDDGSSDETSFMLRNLRGITVVTMEKNGGYLLSTNTGAYYAKGEYIALLNNDTEPVTGWLDNLFSVLELRPDAAIAGSALVYPNGQLQEAGNTIYSDGTAFPIGRGASPGDPSLSFVRETHFCSAASVLIRNSFWKMVGGYDPRYIPAYCEDSDISLAASKHGYTVLFVPSSLVVHHESGSHGEAAGSLIHENTKKLQQKWFAELLFYPDPAQAQQIEAALDSKGIIVVIDYRLPSGIKDSGSIRTLRLIKHLQAIGYHVVLGAPDVMLPLVDYKNLQDSGVEVYLDLKILFSNLAIRKNRITHFWLIREYVYNNVIADCRALQPNALVICDLLDLAYKISKGIVKIAPSQVRAVETADQIVLVNPDEAAILHSVFPGKAVSTVWKEFLPAIHLSDFKHRSGLIFVGGFRHQPNVEGMNWFTDEVLPELRKMKFNAPIKVIGSGLEMAMVKKLGKAGINVLGSQADLEPHYSNSRIAIIPLISGAGMKGKLAESLSFGLPCVTTSKGAEGYRFTPKDEVSIFDDPKGFASAILELHNSSRAWNKAHRAALKYVDNQLSPENVRRQVSEILSKQSCETILSTNLE